MKRALRFLLRIEIFTAKYSFPVVLKKGPSCHCILSKDIFGNAHLICQQYNTCGYKHIDLKKIFYKICQKKICHKTAEKTFLFASKLVPPSNVLLTSYFYILQPQKIKILPSLTLSSSQKSSKNFSSIDIFYKLQNLTKKAQICRFISSMIQLRKNTPSNKTLRLTKNMNTDIWEIDTLNQLEVLILNFNISKN